MTFALLVLLAAAPDAGVSKWRDTAEAPVLSELYSRKPDLEKSTSGKVLPEFASPTAFAKSKHPAKRAWTDAQRAAFDTLVELANAKKPDLADAAYNTEGSPLPFKRLEELKLTPNPKAKRVRMDSQAASCCEDGERSAQIHKYDPVRIRRDAEGRILAALLRDEAFATSDNHGGRVTEKNAHLHVNEWRAFTFDTEGRVTSYARFMRSDEQMRLGPEVQIDVCTTTWNGELSQVDCSNSVDGNDEFTFITTRHVWALN
ncbi:MAG: hypothetical protein ACO1OB_25250 [Archangium sp.]